MQNFVVLTRGSWGSILIKVDEISIVTPNEKDPKTFLLWSGGASITIKESPAKVLELINQ